jgi:hypothetical protein
MGRTIPVSAILLLAFVVHGPLLLMQMPAQSYDANTHMFFASHYAQSWFNPWNPKWYAGFTQTTYPPLTHQLIGLFSHVMGLNMAYMFVQLIAILLLVLGVYRYSRLWVSERAASYAALGAVFLGSLALLVYQAGQLPTTFAGALTLNALPYFYYWSRNAHGSSLLKGFAIFMAGAAAHHVTMIFGMALFAAPVILLAMMDRHDREGDEASVAGVATRIVVFVVLAMVAVAFVLLPYWSWTLSHPLDQTPIPHASRDNYIQNPQSGLNFWIIPHGALPFVFWYGLKENRLRPLFFGWYLTLLIGLAGTTPVAKILLAPMNLFNILTFERFTFWATIMTLPIVGLLAAKMVNRWGRPAVGFLAVAAVFSFALAISWTATRQLQAAPFRTDQVVSFMNRDDHAKFRYLTLGFGSAFARVARDVNASSVDGDYNSARMLPELTKHGAAQLYNSKYFGTAGMEALRDVLKHDQKYGLKYVFVRDRFYEPLLAFAGWRQAEIYDNGNVTLWVKDDVQPAKPVPLPQPLAWHGLMWGIFPIASALLALIVVFLLPERRRDTELVEFPAPAAEPVLREAK